MLGCSNGTIRPETLGTAVISADTRLPLWRRREAQVCIGPERAVFESRSGDSREGRVAQRPMQTEHRREPEGRRNRGALFLAYFFLGTQKEVGRQQAKPVPKFTKTYKSHPKMQKSTRIPPQLLKECPQTAASSAQLVYNLPPV